ncbi:MAG: TIGR01777 family oxidoreductase, partial [Bacteroidota bacterium]
TKARKILIEESRTKGAALLIKSMKEIPNDIIAYISASAIGWYGPDSKTQKSKFTEDDPHFGDFLGHTCGKWEDSVAPVIELNKRLVILRTGIVLSNEGGALVEFNKPLKFGLATILGSGKQVISWIHIDDLVRLYILAIENEKMKGVYNAVAPGPVTNKELILTLAKEKRKNFFVPVHVPSFALKVVLGEMSIEVLKSATVSCDKIKATGFRFIFPTIKSAIENLEK